MAQVNATLTVPLYTDDFGFTYTNFNFKIGNGAPIPESFGYQPRPDTVICQSRNVKMRVLKAYFEDGTVHEYPVNLRSNIEVFATALKSTTPKAVCVELIGEKWSIVPKSVYGDGVPKAAPYTDIAKSAVKESGTFSYSSDISGLGQLDIRYAAETTPAALLAAQKACLVSPKPKAKSVCSGSALGIEARKFIGKALSTNEGDTTPQNTVIRDVKIGYVEADQVKTCAAAAITAFYCMGYKGESIRDVLQLIA